MKCLVTGGHGQLGYDLVKELESRGHEVYAPSQEELDITVPYQLDVACKKFEPDVIFHCAAFTAVDKAEVGHDKYMTWKINHEGTRLVAITARQFNAKMVYISTDYVFDGTIEGEHMVDEDSEPVNYYGLTKKCGEEEVVKESPDYLIVRISWVFGINGNNFIKTMLRLAGEKSEVNVVNDQIGSPTYTKDLSRLLVDMIERDAKGVYHATNEGYCSWAELAEYVFKVSGKNVKVNKILTKDYETVAKRPLNSRLNKDKLDQDGFKRLPDWHDAVDRYIEELKEAER